MKHKIYLTNSISEITEDAKYLGEAETPQEMWQLFNATGIKCDRYCRYILDEKITFIDYGSWSTFLAAEPAFTIADLNK